MCVMTVMAETMQCLTLPTVLSRAALREQS